MVDQNAKAGGTPGLLTDTKGKPMGAAATEIIARAVIRRDDRLLLARQRTKSWSFLPGGHVEPGERVEVALVREITDTDTDPASQEEHLEFHWLPIAQLADTDVRPGALKNALLAAGDDVTPFWHAWNG